MKRTLELIPIVKPGFLVFQLEVRHSLTDLMILCQLEWYSHTCSSVFMAKQAQIEKY